MITTEAQLATALNVPRETLAIAAQTTGVKAYLRALIGEQGEMRVLGFAADGKTVERSGEVWERLYQAPLHPKRKRAK